MIPINENCPTGDYDCAPITIGNIAKGFKILESKSTILLERHQNGILQKLTIDNEEYFKTTDGMLFYGSGSEERCLLRNGKYTCIPLKLIGGACLPHVINVDINGDKGPNKTNRDVFSFNIGRAGGCVGSGGVLPGEIKPYGFDSQNPDCTDIFSAVCTAKVLEEGAMNY